MTFKAWALVGCAAVNVYLLCAMVLFAALVYPQFGAVERAQLPALYSAFNSRIGLTVVAWEFVAFFATLLLYAARPSVVPLWAVHALVALGIGYFIITFAWHLPAHRPLAAGDNSPAVLAPLLASQWARTALQAIRAGALLVWVAQAIGA